MRFAALIYIILGILIKYGKMNFLIAGYNTMPPKKKAKCDVEGIATLMSNVLFGMAFIIILGYAISKWTENPNIENIFFLGAILIGIPYLLIKSVLSHL